MEVHPLHPQSARTRKGAWVAALDYLWALLRLYPSSQADSLKSFNETAAQWVPRPMSRAALLTRIAKHKPPFTEEQLDRIRVDLKEAAESKGLMLRCRRAWILPVLLRPPRPDRSKP